MMLKNVLTGVDDSETALMAAKTAADLAQSFGGRLYVISAYGPSDKRTLSDGIGRVVIDSRQDADRIVTAKAEILRQEFPGVEIIAGAAEGSPPDALVGEADRLGVDLIVVGNKRVQGPSRILGSIARSVASAASCDVYVANTHRR
jgi:nucleotide-binding universal stress UspA family protein